MTVPVPVDPATARVEAAAALDTLMSPDARDEAPMEWLRAVRRVQDFRQAGWALRPAPSARRDDVVLLRAALDDDDFDYDEAVDALDRLGVAADAVAGQDPAPRDEPAARNVWRTPDEARQAAVEGGFIDPDANALAVAFANHRGEGLADRPDRWYARALFDVAEAAGITVIRRPAPAPVVPDEADQATADLLPHVADALRGESDEHGYVENSMVVPVADLRLLLRAAERYVARLVPPTGGDATTEETRA